MELTLKQSGKHQHEMFGSLTAYVDSDQNCWFVANEVALLLGYSNPRAAIAQHCKRGVVKHDTLTKGGVQKVRMISEPDLYRLIFNSTLESAEKFQEWVFTDVLPMIRKTGMYTTDDFIEQISQGTPWAQQILLQAKQHLNTKPANKQKQITSAARNDFITFGAF